MRRTISTAMAAFMLVVFGCGQRVTHDVDLAQGNWPTIVESARGTTVRMVMWDGDPAINAYMHAVLCGNG
ncbi:MAG: hypothetical protein R3C05_19760 [Pirellulaceae bacterium]